MTCIHDQASRDGQKIITLQKWYNFYFAHPYGSKIPFLKELLKNLVRVVIGLILFSLNPLGHV